MKHRIRGKIAGMTALAMAAAAMGGCGSAPKETKETAAEEKQTIAPETAANQENADEKTAAENETQSSDAAMGRYMESEIAMPEGVYGFHDVRQLNDGTLRAVLMEDNNHYGVWDSKDNGQTWEKINDLEALQLGENEYVSHAAVSPEGTVFVDIADNAAYESMWQGGTSEKPANRYATIAPDGTVTALEVDLPKSEGSVISAAMIQKMVYTEENRLLVGTVSANQLYLIDTQSGETVRTYNENDVYVGYFEIAGNSIFLLSDEGVTILDYETGEELSESEALKETLEQKKEYLQVYTSQSYEIVMCGGAQENEIYYATEEGIFRYQSDGALVEQIADGNLNSLAKPSIGMGAMMQMDDGSLLIPAYDDGKAKLLRYTYDANVPTEPDTELKVYTLKNDPDLQQAISMFQTRNPQYYINLEIGMSGDDAVTPSDALRTLNTEIMAGNGPDILVLDGVPMQSYIEKGVLKDISGVYEEVAAGDGLLENIAGAYRDGDAVYAIPSRFKVPVLIGASESLSQIDSLEALTETAQAIRGEDEETREILSAFSIYWMMETFYPEYSVEMVQEDGSLNEEAVRAFAENFKTLFTLNTYPEENLEYRMMFGIDRSEQYDMTDYVSVFEFLGKEIKMQGVNLGSGSAFADATSIGALENLDYELSPLSDKNVFIPYTVMGISSQSDQVEGAEEFLKFMLSEDPQSVQQGGGFPVNRKAFDTETFAHETREILSSSGSSTVNEDGVVESMDFDTRRPENAQIARFKSEVESLDMPAMTDVVMKELIIEQTGRYIADEISLDEAVGTISQKMSLYLAE